MGKLEAIDEQIEKLSPIELAEFRPWYGVFDAETWDRQFEADVKAGKLDAFACSVPFSCSSVMRGDIYSRLCGPPQMARGNRNVGAALGNLLQGR